jgi:hypothetical protein
MDEYLKEIRMRAMKYDLSECFTSDQNFCGKKHKNPPSNEMDFFTFLVFWFSNLQQRDAVLSTGRGKNIIPAAK